LNTGTFTLNTSNDSSNSNTNIGTTHSLNNNKIKQYKLISLAGRNAVKYTTTTHNVLVRAEKLTGRLRVNERKTLMKRYGYLYEQIYCRENLLLAHKNASKGKKDYKEVKEVNEHLDYYIDELQNQLINQTFKNSEYTVFTKMDKGKKREIYKLPYFPDRILHHAIMQILEPIWHKVLIKDTYQSIKGRGIHKCAKKMIKHIKKEKPKYYLQMDVKKFYPSINNEILKTIIRKKIKCRKTLELLYEIIDSTTGVPIGNYLSQYLGNLYLTYVDHKIKEDYRIKQYYRYCDDLVIIHIDRTKLKKLKTSIDNMLQELRLKVKYNWKLDIINIHGINFLGLRVFHNKALLRDKIVNGLMQCVVQDKELSIPSYYGWILLADGYNLWRKVNESKKSN